MVTGPTYDFWARCGSATSRRSTSSTNTNALRQRGSHRHHRRPRLSQMRPGDLPRLQPALRESGTLQIRGCVHDIPARAGPLIVGDLPRLQPALRESGTLQIRGCVHDIPARAGPLIVPGSLHLHPLRGKPGLHKLNCGTQIGYQQCPNRGQVWHSARPVALGNSRIDAFH